MRRFFVFFLLAGSIALAQSSKICYTELEKNIENWKAGGKNIVLKESLISDDTKSPEPGISIEGFIDFDDFYLWSKPFDIQGEKLYRFTAKMRINKIGKLSPPPQFRVRIHDSNENNPLIWYRSLPYDRTRVGTWQELKIEFRTPKEAENVVIALKKYEGWEKFKSEIHADICEINLEEIERLGTYDKYHLSKLPAGLEAMRNTHPRLYITSQKVEELKEKIKTTHKKLWQEVKQVADNAIQTGPPEFTVTGFGGLQQTWQRPVGDTCALLAMTYLLSGEEKYYLEAEKWALASCSYPTWGQGFAAGADLACGHQLFGLALFYDWCHDKLSDQTRKTLMENFEKHGRDMFEGIANGASWHYRHYLQNHLWVSSLGLATAYMAIFDDVEQDLSPWLGLAMERFEKSISCLGDDGASHEGVLYWRYGGMALLDYMELSRELLGVDFYKHPWWKNTADYRLYMSVPRDTWTKTRHGNMIFSYGDAPRSGGYGSILLRRLAAEYNDSHAQWLADEIDSVYQEPSEHHWLNLLWYDPAVKPVDWTQMPTFKHFKDMELITTRSDWSGNESVVFFKCGPSAGHSAVGKFLNHDPGAGSHTHPDVGTFLLIGSEQWLIKDDGYLRNKRSTADQNVLLINGHGQYGEGNDRGNMIQSLLAYSEPKIFKSQTNSNFDHIAGDATEAYLPELGLKKWHRHLLFVKPNALIVIDDVELDKEQPLELRFHPESDVKMQGDHSGVMTYRKARMKISALTCESTNMKIEKNKSKFASREMIHLIVETKKPLNKWQNVTAFSWCSSKEQPNEISLQKGENLWTFKVKDKTITFDWNTGTANYIK